MYFQHGNRRVFLKNKDIFLKRIKILFIPRSGGEMEYIEFPTSEEARESFAIISAFLEAEERY